MIPLLTTLPNKAVYFRLFVILAYQTVTLVDVGPEKLMAVIEAAWLQTWHWGAFCGHHFRGGLLMLRWASIGGF